MKPISSHAIQAIAFILLCDNGIDSDDAWAAVVNGHPASRLARAAENEISALPITRRPGDECLSVSRLAIELLKNGWLPEGWPT